MSAWPAWPAATPCAAQSRARLNRVSAPAAVAASSRAAAAGRPGESRVCSSAHSPQCGKWCPGQGPQARDRPLQAVERGPAVPVVQGEHRACPAPGAGLDLRVARRGVRGPVQRLLHPVRAALVRVGPGEGDQGGRPHCGPQPPGQRGRPFGRRAPLRGPAPGDERLGKMEVHHRHGGGGTGPDGCAARGLEAVGAHAVEKVDGSQFVQRPRPPHRKVVAVGDGEGGGERPLGLRHITQPRGPAHALRDAVVAANHLIPALTGRGGGEILDAACRAVQAEREPEIVRAQRLQRRESRGQGDARSGGWRYTLAWHGARLLGRRRWAQAAWLRRQHDLRFGSRPVRLRLPPPP